MASKRQLLDLLPRDQLLLLLDQHDLTVADRRVKADLVETLAAAHRVKLDEVLNGLPRAELKRMCRALGLDDSGKEKWAIAARLLGKETLHKPAPPSSETLPKPQSPRRGRPTKKAEETPSVQLPRDRKITTEELAQYLWGQPSSCGARSTPPTTRGSSSACCS